MSDAPETMGVWMDGFEGDKTQYIRTDLTIRRDDLALVALVEAAKRASHATTNDGITGRIYTDEAVALQRALAAFTARMEGTKP